MHLTDRPLHAYRDDPAVPAFDDSRPVLFMDGACALCTGGARVVARFDRRDQFRICPVQTPLGRAMLVHFGLDPDDPDSWLYLEEGRAFTALRAMIRVGERLGGVFRLFSLFRLLPAAAQDWLYRRLARNRYRLFGRADMCAVPDPALRRKLLMESGAEPRGPAP